MRLKKAVNIVLLGPPGAGKGTQAIFLIKEYNLVHISTGDMLRDAAKQESELGKEIQMYMQKGELVPDRIVTQSVIKRMAEPDALKGVVLDGYPRTKAQAESLDSSLEQENKTLDMVLYLKTKEETVVKRLSGRRVCPKCGYNYHIVNIPPKKDGLCDFCNVELVQRKDDKQETVKNRLRVYDEEIKELIRYYSKKKLLREFSGDLSAKELFEEIDAVFCGEGLINDNPD
ncbi:MAG: adenylate kinase [Candidatus Omnitrophota bacterium]